MQSDSSAASLASEDMCFPSFDFDMVVPSGYDWGRYQDLVFRLPSTDLGHWIGASFDVKLRSGP